MTKIYVYFPINTAVQQLYSQVAGSGRAGGAGRSAGV